MTFRYRKVPSDQTYPGGFEIFGRPDGATGEGRSVAFARTEAVDDTVLRALLTVRLDRYESSVWY